MLIAKVMGTVVASAKHLGLQSTRLMLVRPVDPDGNPQDNPFLAVDLVSAGKDEMVIVATGSSARKASGHSDAPIDAAIVGILDSLQY